MKIISDKKLKEVKIYKPTTFKDFRGEIWTKWDKKIFKGISFNLSKFTTSKKNVLRGLHFQKKYSQAKLITVTYGKILDVAIDLRPTSKFFGKYFSIEISHKDDFSFFIPENFAHGFLCLSNYCVVNYKLSNYRKPQYEKTLQWNDPDININWPINKPIMSKKDKINSQSFSDLFSLSK